MPSSMAASLCRALTDAVLLLKSGDEVRDTHQWA